MGWSIALISNDVEISSECAKDLWKAVQKGDNPWYEEDEITWRGKLSFNSDHMEHMDYMWNPKIQEVLAKHKVNGDITFGSLDGDNRGQFWGYRFTNGVLTKLTGKVVFEVDPS